GREVVLAPDDGTARFHDARTGRATRETLKLPLATSTQILLSPDDTRLGTSGVEGVAVVDLRRRSARVIDTESNRWTAFDPGGTRIGGSCNEGRARIWNIETGEALALVGHQRGTDTNWLAWTADGARVATASDDWTVRVWDAKDGHPLWRAPLLR